MGWSTVYTSKATAAERKEYLDNYVFKWHGGKTKIIKSAMVGATYYAAAESTKEDGSKEVWAIVCLTENDSRKGEFSYKDMDESAGPCDSKCPAGILNLLSPTDDKYALEWRERCRENISGKGKTVFEIGQQFFFTDAFNVSGLSKIVSKVRSSLVFDSEKGRFRVSTRMLKEYLQVGIVKTA